ncbi:YggT family protein [Marinomonas spartinae]|uniref:YggT family protein n=1 Tax=Marinomonas spartinae TaxID=1792290 RepID=UPI0018F1367F|nr:YggT family protein [Marinomonas spartinae]MBJ7554962.1 YggT family protein [Marinomonas spartinae]
MTSDPLIFLFKTIANLYLFIVLLRLVLQLTRADFYNPISQGIVRATSPILLPLRKVIPSIGRVDMACVVFALLVQFLTVFGVIFFQGAASMTPVSLYVVLTVVGTLYHLLDLYFWALLISVILSWVAPAASHPGAMLVAQITEPLYRMCHRVIPTLGGLDLSPIFLFLAISIIQQFLRGYFPVI